MLVGIVGNLFRTALEDRHNEICGGKLSLHEGHVPSKRLWAIAYP